MSIPEPYAATVPAWMGAHDFANTPQLFDRSMKSGEATFQAAGCARVVGLSGISKSRIGKFLIPQMLLVG